MYNFLRNCHTVFHSGYTILHSHQQCTISPNPHRHMIFLVVLIIGIQIGVTWILIVVLICISLMISDAEHLFMGLLAVCMSSLECFSF